MAKSPEGAIVSIKLDSEDEMIIQALVQEYQIAKEKRMNIHMKVNGLKEQIIEFYDDHTDYEGQIVDSGDEYNVVVVDQSRTTIFTKKQFEEKYGDDWVHEHSRTSYHRRLAIPKKK